MKRGRPKKQTTDNEVSEKTEGNVMDMPIPQPEEVSVKPVEGPELSDFQEEKQLFRIEEAANYMSVSAETIRLWIDHGHLTTQLIGGIKKIPLESMIRCRIKRRLSIKGLPNKELLRIDEVAEYFSLSAKTIYGWIDSGQIEAVNVGPGNTVRIRREEVEKMVQMKED